MSGQGLPLIRNGVCQLRKLSAALGLFEDLGHVQIPWMTMRIDVPMVEWPKNLLRKKLMS